MRTPRERYHFWLIPAIAFGMLIWDMFLNPV